MEIQINGTEQIDSQKYIEVQFASFQSSNNSTGLKIGKSHLCEVVCGPKWLTFIHIFE